MRQSTLMLTAAAILVAGATASFAADASMQSAPAKPAVMHKHADGSHGAMPRSRIEALQAALNNSGEAVAVDGLMGPKTRAALSDYQKRSNLKQTGRPDHATLKHLNLTS